MRNLEREIANVIRGVAVKVAAGETFTTADLAPARSPSYLGPQQVLLARSAERTEEPGVATGLAWTPTGGDILFIEATRMPGKGNLVLTGQLGDVMKESAQAALSYVRAHAGALGIAHRLPREDRPAPARAGGRDPEGRPVGGHAPSCRRMVSLLTGRRVRGDVAMTGEITLRGNVLPVGGIKEKVLAAHRAGIKRVILPERNGKDLVDMPDEVQARAGDRAGQARRRDAGGRRSRTEPRRADRAAARRTAGRAQSSEPRRRQV